jgi:hypothetical protein
MTPHTNPPFDVEGIAAMRTKIADREGDTLIVDIIVDTVYLEVRDGFGLQSIMALDADGVRKLRDICEEFLAVHPTR